jgi:zinc protease
MRPMIRVLAAALACALLAVAGAALAAASPERVVSPGGIEAWLIHDASVPVISLNFSFRDAGAAGDPDGKEGLARLATSLLDESGDDLDNAAFQRRREDLAIQLGFNAALDDAGGSLRTRSESRDAAFDLLRKSLTRPRFDARDVERVRRDVVASLNRDSEEPRSIASRSWMRISFPGHPYARSDRGSIPGIEAIAIEDLQRWAATRLARDNLVIGISGDITAADLAPLLDRTFGPLPAKSETPVIQAAIASAGGQLVLVQKHIPQSVVVVAQPGIAREDPDFYAAYILNYILGGGGFSSLLMEEVREQRGLAYGISTQLVNYRHAPLVWGSTATRNQETGQTIELVRSIWQRFSQGTVTAEQLKDAKTYLTGSFPLQLDSTSNVANLLVAMQLDHLGIDYLDRRNGLIENVTLEQANRVAKALIDPAKLATVVVGEPAGVTPTMPAPGGF